MLHRWILIFLKILLCFDWIIDNQHIGRIDRHDCRDCVDLCDSIDCFDRRDCIDCIDLYLKKDVSGPDWPTASNQQMLAHLIMTVLLRYAVNENITTEDPEQPEERAGVSEGFEGRKREGSWTADEGVDGGLFSSFSFNLDLRVDFLKGCTFRVLKSESIVGEKREGVQRTDKRLEDCRGRDRRAEKASERGERHSEEERRLPDGGSEEEAGGGDSWRVQAAVELWGEMAKMTKKKTKNETRQDQKKQKEEIEKNGVRYF